MSSLVSHFYRFGDFAVDMDQRVLLRRDKPISLTPKVFETLLILIEQHGRIVGKDELMNRLWPYSFVEEANLTFNIQQLRKALGDDARRPKYVETIARRGYRFIAEVEEVLSEAGGPRGRISLRPGGLESSAENNLAAGSENVQGADAAPETPAPALSTAVARRPATRRYLVWSAVGVVLIGSLAALVFRWLSARNAPPPRMEITRLTSNGKSTLAAVSPDGRFVAYIIDDDKQHSLWLKNIATGSDVQILPPAADTPLRGVTFSPDGNHVFYGAKGKLYQLPVLGGTPKIVLADYGGPISFSPDGKQITFIRYLSEGEETAVIVVTDADGTNERIIASSKRPNIFLRSAAWSPDGTAIACVAMTAAGSQEVVAARVADGTVSSVPSPRWPSLAQVVWRPDGSSLLVIVSEDGNWFSSQIWELSYPGGGARKLTNDYNNYESISLTADGRGLVAVRLEQVAHIWLMPSGETNQARQLTSGFEKHDGLFTLDWLPDGRIVYEAAPSGQSEIWTIDADGSNARRIAAGALSPGVSPDGNCFVFQDRDGEGSGLFRMSVSDGAKKRLTTGTDIDATFSPDGQWIVFTRWADEVALWKVPTDGGPAVRLTNVSGYPIAPAISPDGELIAFYRDRSGSMSPPPISLIPFSGGDIIKAFDGPLSYDSRYGKATLQWTPDGQAINYVLLRADVSNIWRQPVDGGPPVQVTDFRDGRIFNFAYSRDGKQLALSRGTFNRDVVLVTDP